MQVHLQLIKKQFSDPITNYFLDQLW